LILGRGFWGPNSTSGHIRGLNNLAQAGWYYHQIERMSADQKPDLDVSPWRALLAHFGKDMMRALRRKLA
jgi:hypothetical protein